MEEINLENTIDSSDSSDYEICDNCLKIFNYEQLNPCEFCFQYLCEICLDKVYKNKEDFEYDADDNLIKPDGYNCISCNKIEQEKKINNRKNEIYDEILKLLKTKKQITKCKQLIDELKLIN